MSCNSIATLSSFWNLSLQGHVTAMRRPLPAAQWTPLALSRLAPPLHVDMLTCKDGGNLHQTQRVLMQCKAVCSLLQQTEEASLQSSQRMRM